MIVTVFCVVVFAFVLGQMSWPEAASAGVGPGEVDSFPVTCSQTVATKIEAPRGGQISYTCQPFTAGEEVRVGDPGITSTNSPKYSSDFGADVRREYCLGVGGAVTIVCRAMIAGGSYVPADITDAGEADGGL